MGDNLNSIKTCNLRQNVKVFTHECSVLSLTSVMRLVAHQYNVAQQNRQAQLNLIKHNHRVEQPITELQLRIFWHI